MNWLKVTAVPFFHAPAPSVVSDHLFKADKIPWLGLCVRVTKVGPLKGYTDVVKSILCGQVTSSGDRNENYLSMDIKIFIYYII